MLAPFQSFLFSDGVFVSKKAVSVSVKLTEQNKLGCSAYSCSNTILHAPESTPMFEFVSQV